MHPLSPAISVIVCTFNTQATIRNLLGGLINQDFPKADYEILLVDNGSTDRTLSLAREYIQDHPDHRIRLIQEKTPGKSHALNTGVSHAQGRIIAFVDDDISVSKHWLGSVAKAFEDRNIGGIGGKILPAWHGKKPSWFTRAVAGFTPIHDFGDTPIPYWPPWSCPIGCNMAFRKLILDQVGPFDTNLGHRDGLKIGGEEAELCVRIHKLGYKLMYWPRAEAVHPFTREEATRAYWRKRVFVQGRVAAYILARMGFTIRTREFPREEPTLLHYRQKGRNLTYFQLKTIFSAGFFCGFILGPNTK